MWKQGYFDDLLKAIQKNLMRRGPRHENREGLGKSFAHLMFEGRTRDAFRLLNQGQLLSLNSNIQCDGTSCTTKEVLYGKHSPPGPVLPEYVLLKATPSQDHDPHFTLFDALDGDLIKRTALKVQGAAGPSGVDSVCWRHMCSSFSKASDDLCSSLASLARKLATQYVDPVGVSSFTSCRLIALDKDPGVRPIGIGEV